MVGMISIILFIPGCDPGVMTAGSCSSLSLPWFSGLAGPRGSESLVTKSGLNRLGTTHSARVDRLVSPLWL